MCTTPDAPHIVAVRVTNAGQWRAALEKRSRAKAVGCRRRHQLTAATERNLRCANLRPMPASYPTLTLSTLIATLTLTPNVNLTYLAALCALSHTPAADAVTPNSKTCWLQVSSVAVTPDARRGPPAASVLPAPAHLEARPALLRQSPGARRDYRRRPGCCWHLERRV